MSQPTERSPGELAAIRDQLERLMFKGDACGLAQLMDAEKFPVNHTSSRGDTLLHSLAMITVNPNTLVIADQLISRGAKLYLRSNDGHTALSNAVMTGGVALCMLLLHRGAKVDAPTGNGSPALHHAFPLFDVDKAAELTRVLLKAGADTKRFARMTGELALNEAVLRSNPGVVMELIKAGEDPRAISPKSGLTALRLAKEVRSPNDGTLLSAMQAALDARLAGEAIDSIIKKAPQP